MAPTFKDERERSTTARNITVTSKKKLCSHAPARQLVQPLGRIIGVCGMFPDRTTQLLLTPASARNDTTTAPIKTQQPRFKPDPDGSSVNGNGNGNGKRKKQDDEIGETDSHTSNIVVAVLDDAEKKRWGNVPNLINQNTEPSSSQ